MASWAALRTFGNELRLADPYGPLVGDEVITVHSPAGAPRRSREGSFPVAAFLGSGNDGGRSFPIFGDNGELNAFHPGLAPDAFYMVGGETEGDGDDGLFVKQDAEPETFGNEELHNPDIEVSPYTLGNTDVQKQANAGIICGAGWSVGVPPLGLDTPADSPVDPETGFPPVNNPDFVQPAVYPDSPESVEPPDATYPPVPPPISVSVPDVSKATAVAGAVSGLQLMLRAQGYKQDGTFVPRSFDLHTPPNNTYSVRVEVICLSGSLTPSLQGSGASNVGTPITTSGIIEQSITIATAHNKLVLTKDANFVGEVLWASVRWVRRRKTGAKKFITLTDGVTQVWYKRTPEEITLERCGIGNVRSDDEDNMLRVQSALNDAQEWARDTGIPIKLGPKTYCVDGRPTNDPAAKVGAFHVTVGDNIVIEGCGKQSVLKNCRTDPFAVISIQGGNNITLRNFTVDGNCYEHPFVFVSPDHRVGGEGVLFLSRSTPMERLVIENLWVRRTDAYGVGVQNADIKSALIDGLFLEDCGTDGIDFKQYSLDNAGDSSRGELDRKAAILNNIHVTGFGRNIDDGGLKTAVDLRGYILASNIFVHDMKRIHDINSCGIRFNADVGSNAGRQGGRTSQLSNARVICTDPYTHQSKVLLPDGRVSAQGRCIGMQIWTKDVNVSNFLCEGAHTGIEIKPSGPEADTINSVTLSNIRISGARGSDGTGAGIYWSGSSGNLATDPAPLRTGYSQLGPFTITDCDRGFEIEGIFLRGAGIIRDCGVGLYFKSQEVADKTQLDVFFRGNGATVSSPIAGVTHYLSRIITLTTTNVDSAAGELDFYLHHLNSLGGGELIINGTHLLNQQVAVTFNDDVQIVINGKQGVPTLKAQKLAPIPPSPEFPSGVPGLPVAGNPLIQLTSHTQNHGTLFINNLEIDCSEAGNNTIGGNTAGLSLHDWKTAHLHDFGGSGGVVTDGNSTTGTLAYDNGGVAFTVGQTVTGQTSHAVGTVVSKTQSGSAPNIKGMLGLIDIHAGRFIDNEDIIGPGVGGGIAKASGRLRGNLTGDQLLSTVSIYDFLWDGGWARDWSDMAFYPGGDNTRDGLPFDSKTANFVLGDLIVGTTSNASGILTYQVDSGSTGILYLSSVRGTFYNNEVIHGNILPAMTVRGTATVNGGMTGQAGDGFVNVIRNVIIERCTNGIAFKREGYSLHVDGCTFRACGGGVTTAEVTAPFVGSGRMLEVSNCKFIRTTNTGAPLRAKGDTRVHFHDNLIQDWGCYADGTAAQSSIWSAVHIQGPRDFVVNGNIFEMINWLPTGSHTGIHVEQFNGALESPGNGVLQYDGQTANFPDIGVVIGGTSAAMGTMTGQMDYDATSGEIYLKDVTGVFLDDEHIIGLNGGEAIAKAIAGGVLTGHTHTPMGGITRGNTYRNIDVGVREFQTGPNCYLDEFFDNVVNPAVESGFNPGSTLRYTYGRATYASPDAQPIWSEQVGTMHRIVTPGTYVYSGLTSFTLTSGNRPSTVRLTGNIGTVNQTLSLNYLQAGSGSKFRIIRVGPGTADWDVTAITETTSNSLKLLAVNTWCDVEHDGTEWRLTGYGAL